MLDPNVVSDEVTFLREAQRTAEARFQKLCDEADAMSIQGYLHDGTVVYWIAPRKRSTATARRRRSVATCST